jgi:hypothetical protein
VKKNYQRKQRKSNQKFEVVRGQELLVRVSGAWNLPLAVSDPLDHQFSKSSGFAATASSYAQCAHS